MTWRWGAPAILAVVAIANRISGAEDAALSWYPLQPGDAWVYEKESRSGDMAHPIIERWTTEETVVRSVPVPEISGNLITKRTRVLDHTIPPDFIPLNDSTTREPAESHLLTHGNCVYVFDGIDAQGSACDPNVVNGPCLRPLDEKGRVRTEYREDLLRGRIPADFCFPMEVGRTWVRWRSRRRPTSGSGVWRGSTQTHLDHRGAGRSTSGRTWDRARRWIAGSRKAPAWFRK